MKLDVAIASNQGLAKRMEREGFPTVAKAIKLGIEALKRIRAQRNSTKKGGKRLLPGETKE